MRLQCVTVLTGHLNWGCMVGECADGRQVTVQLCEHRRQRLLGGWPMRGDVLGCVELHHSVYEPKVLMKGDDLRRARVLRRQLPVRAAIEPALDSPRTRARAQLCLLRAVRPDGRLLLHSAATGAH